MSSASRSARVLALFLLLPGAACSDGGQTAARAPQASAPQEVDTAARRQQLEQRAADSGAAVARFATLRKQFTFRPDEIEGGGWYTARSQTVDNSWNRTYLGIHVARDGRTYLSSHYYGENWIFHEYIIVRIGDKVLRSVPIPSYDNSNVRHNSGGSVWETLHMSGDQDAGILAALVRAPEETVILVRLGGDQFHRDFTLTKRDRAAIREGVEMGRLLNDWPSLREAGK